MVNRRRLSTLIFVLFVSIFQVHFANSPNTSIDYPMSDQSFGYNGKNTESSSSGKCFHHSDSHRSQHSCVNDICVFYVLAMLKIAPAEIITFSKVGNELVGTVDIYNIVKYPITYKVI